jgi:hypothetical protein
MPFGFGLIFKAAKLILRFAGLYYQTNRGKYTVSQQAVIDPLIVAAESLVAAIDITLLP